MTLVAAAILTTLVFVAIASADTNTSSHRVAGDYTIALPVFSGPPVTSNGVTTISGTVDVEIRGSQIGSLVSEFTCVLGTDGSPNVCKGTLVFEGSVRGRIGTYKAIMDDWTSGGDEGFSSHSFKLVEGSGTGDLWNLVEMEGTVQRDETVEMRVGIYWGNLRFEGDESPSKFIQIAGDYTVLGPPTLSGPPVTEDGETTISGTVDVAGRGSMVGDVLVSFTCALGTDGASNVCEGGFDFDGVLNGRTGTFKTDIDDWTAGGDAAFTSSHFTLISGSGTGELSNLVEMEGTIQRDETVDPPVGVYLATMRFAGEVERAPEDLSGYSIGELFEMEKSGDITTDELAAELERRN